MVLSENGLSFRNPALVGYYPMLEGQGGGLSQKKELFSLPPHKSGKTSDVENPEMTFVRDP